MVVDFDIFCYLYYQVNMMDKSLKINQKIYLLIKVYFMVSFSSN